MIDPDLVRRLYHQCDGWVQRMHEKLVEEEGIQVSYSTLTRIVRQLDLGHRTPGRCQHVPDEPGAEMQHDTTVYQVKLSDQPTRVIASLLYLRYSKRRYLKFYRLFDRFAMKCFLHEALMFWGHAARQCIIDNTNLARLRGSGKQAVIVPEMAAFAERYGFHFVCHELGHANRKAGEERSFWTVETNFLPGRSFESLEDLNRQAFEWATVRMHHRRSRLEDARYPAASLPTRAVCPEPKSDAGRVRSGDGTGSALSNRPPANAGTHRLVLYEPDRAAPAVRGRSSPRTWALANGGRSSRTTT